MDNYIYSWILVLSCLSMLSYSLHAAEVEVYGLVHGWIFSSWVTVTVHTSSFGRPNSEDWVDVSSMIFNTIHSKPPTLQVYTNLPNITAFPDWSYTSSTRVHGPLSHHHPSVFCLQKFAFDTRLRPNSLMLCHFMSGFPHDDLLIFARQLVAQDCETRCNKYVEPMRGTSLKGKKPKKIIEI